MEKNGCLILNPELEEEIMPRSADTALRHLETLMAIPSEPDSRSTREIYNLLCQAHPEYNVSIRTLQRSLDDLSRKFPITAKQRGNRQYWYWMNPDQWFQVPAMSGSAAFMLRLAEEHLKPVFPPESFRVLEPYFKKAEDILRGTDLGNWSERVALIDRGPVLKPPPVSDNIREVVCEALIRRKRLQVVYRSRGEASSRQMELHPLGIVVRRGLTYIVATAWDYNDVRHFALHRIETAKSLLERSKELDGFDLTEYLQGEAFSYPSGSGKIKLKAVFDKESGVHLTENQLSADHQAVVLEDGRVQVEATVEDTEELRWWLKAFGSKVEVLGPERLRQDFQQEAERLSKIYC
ncbi:MAG: WYL domain-containing protein [Gammaproteobacteria bacterium]|nr:WYL domain-containing protein [Gammaproteobacteria bacterium]MCY4275884.1 WYL domain-containing protein [Gammaproteobacteria bacterium]